MNIEILTASRKLSKSIIKQLDPSSDFDIQHLVNVERKAFYVRGIGINGAYKTGIFKTNCKWVVLPLLDWEASKERLTIKARSECNKGVRFREFRTEEAKAEWLVLYYKAKKLCEKNHLFI